MGRMVGAHLPELRRASEGEGDRRSLGSPHSLREGTPGWPGSVRRSWRIVCSNPPPDHDLKYGGRRVALNRPRGRRCEKLGSFRNFAVRWSAGAWGSEGGRPSRRHDRFKRPRLARRPASGWPGSAVLRDFGHPDVGPENPLAHPAKGLDRPNPIQDRARARRRMFSGKSRVFRPSAFISSLTRGGSRRILTRIKRRRIDGMPSISAPHQ